MNSPFAWPGGKRALLNTLLERLPEHKIYVEVFAGSAKLLFAKEPSRAEVINDLNGDVASFFRVVKHRPAELAELLEHEVVHPARFRELRKSQPGCELERALKFAYTGWYSFGAKGEHFAAAQVKELLQGRSRRPLDAARDLLEKASERLRKVRIEQRDCCELIRRFDTPDTFFYLDPPYVHFSSIARYEALSVQQRIDLFTELSRIEGTFLMSFDDCEEIRELAKAFGMYIEQVQTRYTLASSGRGAVNEVLISNSEEIVDVDAARIA